MRKDITHAQSSLHFESHFHFLLWKASWNHDNNMWILFFQRLSWQIEDIYTRTLADTFSNNIVFCRLYRMLEMATYNVSVILSLFMAIDRYSLVFLMIYFTDNFWSYFCDNGDIFLTHWGREKMDNISQRVFSNVFSSVEMFEFRSTFHWSVQI